MAPGRPHRGGGRRLLCFTRWAHLRAGHKGERGMVRLTKPSKHTVYYELLDACKKGGCPLCTMALDTVARYLDILIYENVNDPQTRDAVVAARGYCNGHSWQLRATSGAAFGTALMYRDVLQHVAEEIGRQADGAHR